MTDDKLNTIVHRIERLEEEQKAVLAAKRGSTPRPRRPTSTRRRFARSSPNVA